MDSGMMSILMVFGSIAVVLVLMVLFRKLLYYLPDGIKPPDNEKKNKKNIKIVIVEKLKKLLNK